MDHTRPLAPCLIGRGTVSDFRDMLRALETLENVEYRFVVHGDEMETGSAALVKLMADQQSSTMIVNGCLFLNVASFSYLDFEPANDDRWLFRLHGDGAILELTSQPEADEAERNRPHLLSEEEAPDFSSLILLDDEDDED